MTMSLRRPFNVRAEDGLTWFPERGMGYYPVRSNGHVYDQAYFDKYVAYGKTPLGHELTAARVRLVQRFLTDGSVIDVGIGAGDFVQARGECAPTYGFDINPVGVAWLQERGLFRNPEVGEVDGLTFWDSIEHIAEPELTLSQTTWAFLSLPIFTGPDHVLRSKHFRRDEHCWYFTRRGLIDWMGGQGFVCREHTTMESLLGREDIETFVFEAVSPADVKGWGP